MDTQDQKGAPLPKGCIIAFLLTAALAMLAALGIAYWMHHDSFQDYDYEPSGGDHFTVSVHDYLGKATLICKEYRFSCGLKYFQSGDVMHTLCDTPNITCYEISGVTICKVKAYEQMYILNDRFCENTEVCKYLNGRISEDEAIRDYVLPYLKTTL